MITGLIIRITTPGGLCGNPPGSLAACMALHLSPTLPSEPLADLPSSGVFVLQNGALLVLRWHEFHALTVVVGHANNLRGVFEIEHIHALTPELRRTIFTPFLNADWPASPRQIHRLSPH